MREIFGPSTGSDEGVADDANLDLEVSFESQEIPPAELVRLGIELSRLGNEQYRTIQLPLLNQVTVRGTVRIAKREQPNGVQIFWHLDPRFANSEMFGNTWTKMERNDLGKAMPTMPASYAGCGGYLAITEIDGERHQILVESRMILHEPKEWFSGSNFLRAKLPPALQENARSFRRRLAK